jgi:Tol biopolymer transport system component
VFLARKGTGANQLWLRPLDSTEITPLPGTEQARLPFWSPDGGEIAFFAARKLKKVDLRTNAITTLTDAVRPGGGTWNRDGVIVFSPVLEGPLFRVSSGGGTPVPLTTLDAGEGESAHIWPHFLPDGRRFLFQVLGLNNRGIYASTLDGAGRTLVLKQDGFEMTSVGYSSSGHLVYVRNQQLVGRPFDAERLVPTGAEVTLADDFSAQGGAGTPLFAVARSGVLTFRPIGARPIVQPTWYSRTGVAQGPLGPPGPYGTIALSPDGRMLALDHRAKEISTWILDVQRGTLTRFTSGAYAADPVWFPDADRLAFVSVRDTPPNPFVKTLAGVETRLARLPFVVEPGDVTPDGQRIVGSVFAPETNTDLWIFSVSTNDAPSVFVRTPFDELDIRLRAGGTWAAFTSNESGTNEIYVTTFPSAGRRYRVSSEGGEHPHWNPNGRELFFRSGNQLMSASFSESPSGEPVLGNPRALFALPERAGFWVPADNGQRFLINVEVTPAESTPMTILLNWQR